MGSTREARRAGMRQAINDTAVMTSAVPRRVAMCSVGTSKRTLCIALPASHAPIKPRMVPAARRRRPNERNCAPIWSRLRAKRHANADLAASLRDGVTENAICSDRGQEQRDAGENSGERGRGATRDQAVCDARIHRAEVIDRKVRIGCAHQFSQRLGKRFRTLARARDDENVDAVAIKERQVNRALPLRFRELRLFYRADDADNGEQFCVVRVVALRHALTKRAAIGPVAPGEIFVHHADPFRAMRIRRGQKPSLAQTECRAPRSNRR